MVQGLYGSEFDRKGMGDMFGNEEQYLGVPRARFTPGVSRV